MANCAGTSSAASPVTRLARPTTEPISPRLGDAMSAISQELGMAVAAVVCADVNGEAIIVTPARDAIQTMRWLAGLDLRATFRRQAEHLEGE